jgi:hypothetical protein
MFLVTRRAFLRGTGPRSLNPYFGTYRNELLVIVKIHPTQLQHHPNVFHASNQIISSFFLYTFLAVHHIL